MQGLADAAAENLQTAKTFLATRRASSDNTFCTKATGGALPGKGSTAVVAGASPSTENLGRSGGGARRERGQAPCKAANRGISAVDLEALIADLLSRQSPLPQAKGAGRASGDGIAAGVVLEATAEEVASWLVRELGHRRQVGDTCSISLCIVLTCHLAVALSATRFPTGPFGNTCGRMIGQ